jgi:hypothetical protein
MTKGILFIVGLFLSIQVIAQTGIGTTSPNASAKLDVYADNKGFLPPRVSLSSVTDQSTIPSPATGLLVYCKGDAGLAAGYYYWNGNAWATIATAGGSGSFAASFLRGSRTAVQSSIAVGGIVSFSAVDNTSGQDISLNTTNGKITLAPGNTYRLIAAVPNFSGNRPAFMWYNETTSSYIGSAANGYSPTDGAANAGAFGGLAEVIITPYVSTVLSFRLLSSQSSGAVTVGGLVDFSITGSYPWFEAQVISGNSPVTGQSVDYVSVGRSTSQTVNTGDNLIFNTINSGNIPYNSTTGNFSLTAGKTYRLTGSVSLDGSNAANSAMDIAWKTAAGDILGNKGLTISTNYPSSAAGNGVTDIIYTPSINTTVTLNVISSSSNAKTVANYTYANITQIGSSAIINPWLLSGTNTYNSTGNVGIGTTTPSEKLEVSGNVKATNFIGTASAALTAPTNISFGEIDVPQILSVNTGFVDLANIPLPSAGTYKVTYVVRGSVTTSATLSVLLLRNGSNTQISGTEAMAIYNAAGVQVTCTQVSIITTTAAETYKLSVWTQSGAGNFNVINDGNGRSKVLWEKIQ